MRPSRYAKAEPAGPAAKSRGLRSPVAHRFARSWQATAPTHGTWLACKAPASAASHFVKTAETGNRGRWRRHPRPAHHQP